MKTTKVFLMDLYEDTEKLIVEAASYKEAWCAAINYIKTILHFQLTEPMLTRHWADENGSEIVDFGHHGYWLKFI